MFASHAATPYGAPMKKLVVSGSAITATKAGGQRRAIRCALVAHDYRLLRRGLAVPDGGPEALGRRLADR